MNVAVEKFKKLRCGWNKKQITQKRLEQLCRRLKCRVQEMPLRVPGFYMSLRGTDFIAIDERLPAWLRFKIHLHEFGHHVLHPGKPNFYLVADKDSKEESEAELFAVCAILPLPLFKKIEREGFDCEFYGIEREIYQQRKEIYEKYKI